MSSFENKVTLVTGAGSGIGRACALVFAVECAKVVVADGVETVGLIKTAGGEAMFVPCNVARSADVSALLAETVQTNESWFGTAHYDLEPASDETDGDIRRSGERGDLALL